MFTLTFRELFLCLLIEGLGIFLTFMDCFLDDFLFEVAVFAGGPGRIVAPLRRGF